METTQVVDVFRDGIGVVIRLVIGGDWMLGNLQEYARELLELIRA